MFNNQEDKFCSNYRAIHGGTQVDAMIQYRELMKTNTPYVQLLKNEEIEGLNDRRKRGF